MAKTVSAKLDTDQVEYLEEQVTVGNADSISEAVRKEISGNGRTSLQKTIDRFRDAFGIAGIAWVGLSFVYPIEVRALAIPVFAIAVSLHLSSMLLERVEPGVSGWVNGVLRGDDA